MTQKRADFNLFSSIIELINKKEHLSMEGFIKILALKSKLNLGLTAELNNILNKYQTESGYNMIIEREIIEVTEELNPLCRLCLRPHSKVVG
jgi:hypothetical protein